MGKTTLVRRVTMQIPSVSMAGFYTIEMRSKGYRSGFELRGLNGERRILAHVDIQSRQRVGRYGVDTMGFEAFLEQLDLLNPKVGLVVIDEIGKMELFSNRFQRLIGNILNTDKLLLATIALHCKGLIQEVKQRADIHLLELTPDNRDHLIGEVLECD